MSERPSSVVILIESDYEDMELMYPKYRLQEAGLQVVIAGPQANRKYFGKYGYPCSTDVDLASLDAKYFDGIICPGGWAPDKLRRLEIVKTLVRQFHENGKLIGAICHGGLLPISAGIYRGIRVTGSPGIKDDLVNAGAIFEDAPVVVDGRFVSSRKPDDCPEFMKAILKVLNDGPPGAPSLVGATRPQSSIPAEMAAQKRGK